MKLKFTFFLMCWFSLTTYAQVCPSGTDQYQVLLAGDSWAQYMWDDGTYDQIFDKFGFGDVKVLSRSLGSDPGAGYTGPEYAIGGSLAVQWADMANYPWVDNVIAELDANPSIQTVILSIGGNDILAGKSGGGWYQNMDLDVPGSEDALFDVIENSTFTVIDAIQAAHPSVEILVASYDYPNFNTGFWCFLFACPRRNDLSYDPDNPISDAELNQMMISIESRRIASQGINPKIHYDNSIGLMHYYYGDGTNAPGTLPYPDQTYPFDPAFEGGNPVLPTLRNNFRSDIDPIHLDVDGYECKIINQTKTYFMPRFRGEYDVTIFSNGGTEDGWSTGSASGTDAIRVGDASPSQSYHGILSFDTGSLPDNADINSASLYVMRDALVNANPFVDVVTFGSPMVDVVSGTFGGVMVENGDATATADAVDAGCFHGTVTADDYALRINLNADGLAAINTTGTTQFRIYFPNANVGEDYVAFKGGNATLDADVQTESLGEFMNSAKPFLDIDYSIFLPVELTEFSAREQNRKSLLDWRTASEEDFKAFFVEHSLNGKDWLEVGYVEAKGASAYEFLHENPSFGNNYYRLRMMDEDGSFEYSDTRVVRISKPMDDIAVFPNPFSNQLSIRTGNDEPFQVALFDMLGRSLYQRSVDDSRTHTFELADEATGMYYLHIFREGECKIVKLARR